MTRHVPKWMRLYDGMGVDIPETIPDNALYVTVNTSLQKGFKGLVTVVTWLEPVEE